MIRALLKFRQQSSWGARPKGRGMEKRLKTMGAFKSSLVPRKRKREEQREGSNIRERKVLIDPLQSSRL